MPINFSKMTKGIYKYTIPLILYHLVFCRDPDKQHIKITLGKWARSINMVNGNYNIVKYNRESASKVTNIKIDAINDFYSKTDNMITYYILNSLQYLKQTGFIGVEPITILRTETPYVNVSCDKTIYNHVVVEDKVANATEMDLYYKCVKEADIIADIKEEKERYYSKKTPLFQGELKKLLSQNGISLVYKAYDVHLIHEDKCKDLLSKFKVDTSDVETNLISGLNKDFSEMIVNNADKRFNSDLAKYFFYENKEEYVVANKNLCDINILFNAPKIRLNNSNCNIADDYTTGDISVTYTSS